MKDQSARAQFGRVEYIRFALTHQEQTRFLVDYQFAKLRLESCEECIGYELLSAPAEGQFILRIEWDLSSRRWPLGHRPDAVHRFLLSLRSGLKAVKDVVACEPVGGLSPFSYGTQRAFPFQSPNGSLEDSMQ